MKPDPASVRCRCGAEGSVRGQGERQQPSLWGAFTGSRRMVRRYVGQRNVQVGSWCVCKAGGKGGGGGGWEAKMGVGVGEAHCHVKKQPAPPANPHFPPSPPLPRSLGRLTSRKLSFCMGTSLWLLGATMGGFTSSGHQRGSASGVCMWRRSPRLAKELCVCLAKGLRACVVLVVDCWVMLSMLLPKLFSAHSSAPM